MIRIFATVFRAFLYGVVALAVSACSGGGGGGGGGSAGISGDYTLSTNSLSFEAFSGGLPPGAQSVTLTVVGNTPIFLDNPLTSGPVVANVQLTIVDPVAGIARLDITPAPTSGPGMVFGLNVGTVTIVACLNLSCSNRLPDKVINITYQVKRLVSVDRLNFVAVENGAAPAAQLVAISVGQAVNQNWNSGLRYVAGQPNWLNLSKASGMTLPDQINVSVDAGLPKGVYQADLSIATGFAGGITHTIFITYTVQGALGVSSQPNFNITTASVPADLSRTLTVNANDPSSPTLNWTATVNVPWLSLAPPNGDTAAANQLTVSLVGSEMDNLKHHNRAGDLLNHTGVITLTSPGLSDTQVPVVLNINLPMVEFVSPHAAVENVQAEVILRGHAFTGATSVSFGGRPATSINVLSDTEIRATHPGLAAAAYVVSVPNTLGIERNNAALNVVAVPSYAAESIANAGTKNKIVYDAVRRAIYLANTGFDSLDKYTFTPGNAPGSQWVLSSQVIADLQDIALATDGSYILAVTETNAAPPMHEIDPDDLDILFTSAFGGFSPHTSVEFDSYGAVIMARRDSSSNNPVEALRHARNSPGAALSPALRNGLVGATRDGRLVLLGSRDNVPAGPVYLFTPGNNPIMASVSMNVTGISPLNVTAISSDRTGTRWLLNKTRVHNGSSANFSLIGSLPDTTLGSALSHNGTVIYTIDSSGPNVALRRFNSSTLAEIVPSTPLAAQPGSDPVLTLSHDGGTLFIAGNQNVLIMPTP